MSMLLARSRQTTADIRPPTATSVTAADGGGGRGRAAAVVGGAVTTVVVLLAVVFAVTQGGGAADQTSTGQTETGSPVAAGSASAGDDAAPSETSPTDDPTEGDSTADDSTADDDSAGHERNGPPVDLHRLQPDGQQPDHPYLVVPGPRRWQLQGGRVVGAHGPGPRRTRRHAVPLGRRRLCAWGGEFLTGPTAPVVPCRPTDLSRPRTSRVFGGPDDRGRAAVSSMSASTGSQCCAVIRI